MIRVQLAGAADIAALLAAHASPRPDRAAGSEAAGSEAAGSEAAGSEAGWAEQARPVPHRIGPAGDGSDRVHPALGAVR